MNNATLKLCETALERAGEAQALAKRAAETAPREKEHIRCYDAEARLRSARSEIHQALGPDWREDPGTPAPPPGTDHGKHASEALGKASDALLALLDRHISRKDPHIAEAADHLERAMSHLSSIGSPITPPERAVFQALSDLERIPHAEALEDLSPTELTAVAGCLAGRAKEELDRYRKGKSLKAIRAEQVRDTTKQLRSTLERLEAAEEKDGTDWEEYGKGDMHRAVNGLVPMLERVIAESGMDTEHPPPPEGWPEEGE